MRKFLLLLAFVTISFSQISFAGTTGKIAGYVYDKTTNEPLIGANVILAGTNMGAATDANGYFVILNVPPGTYTLKVNYIGYSEWKATGVEVKIDLTTFIKAKLTPTSIESETVVVEAPRPVVVKDISNSQVNLTSNEIEELPIQTVDQVLSLQAGIELGSEGIIVRGGSANQTVFMVDGLSTNDERGNLPSTSLSLSSIKEIKIQTGGFNAEYGDVRSGLVNVVTKEGSKNRYTFNAILRYRPPAPKNFGPSIYDPYSYFNRPYMDPAVCWTGTDNGAWDEYTRKQYPNFEGWNAISEATLQDDDPNNDLTPEAAQRLFEWQRRRTGNIEKPDYFIDVGFGGPVPFISEYLGDLRFFFSHFNERNMFIFPLSRDSYSENKTILKLSSDITPTMKLNFIGSYNEVKSVSPYQWTTTPTGRVLRSQAEIADLLNSNTGASILYMPGYYSPSDIYRSSFGIKFTHAINSRSYYDTKIQYKRSKYNTFKIRDRNLAKIYEPVPGIFVDEAPFGYYGYGVNAIDGMSMGGWMNLGRDKSVLSTFNFNFDFTSQFNPANQFKTGLSFVYNDFDINSFTDNPAMSTWRRSLVYRVFPYRIGAYIQDKLEFEGFIANVGLRLDYSNSNTKNYVLDQYDKYFKAGYGSRIEEEVPYEKSKPVWNLSPRLGVSHPITKDSKLYFNYGHFRSEPASSYRFRIQRESNGLVTFIGNPNMEMEKTVAYELGYEHNVMNEFLLKIAAYYKDITLQPGWIYYQNINGSVQYRKAANNNYEDIRGVEITLNRTRGKWINGFINYTYDVRTSGYFGILQVYEDPNEQRDYLKTNPYQSRPHPRPYARLNVSIHPPNGNNPDWLLDDWYLNILASWKTGSYYRYRVKEGEEREIQWVDRYNVDLKLSKVFRLSDFMDLELFVDITNVFNFKYMSFAGFSDNFDWQNYLESLRLPFKEGVYKGDDKIGDYRPDGVKYEPLEPNPDNDPAIAARNDERIKNKAYIDNPNIKAFTFLNPRNVIFGIKLNF